MKRLFSVMILFLLALFGGPPIKAANPVMTPSHWLPNDNAINIATGDQQHPAISMGNGTFLAVWSDTRALIGNRYEEESSSDIYGMRLDANGNPLEATPFGIAVGRAAQEKPKIAWNGTNWLVVYETNDLNDIGSYYEKVLEARRVAPSGQVLDEQPIKLRALKPSGSNWVVASDGTNWVVVNQSSNSGDTDIKAVRVSANGQLLDPTPRSLVPGTFYLRSNFHLAHANGVFLLTFNDQPSVNDTKAVRFDSNLNLLDSAPFQLLPTAIKDLASNGNGFYMVWDEQQPDFSHIVTGTRVSTTGQKLDDPGVAVSAAYSPGVLASIRAVWDGLNWRVSWVKNQGDMYLARVNSAGQVLDFDGVPVPGPRSGPQDGDGNGGVQIVWPVFENNNYDVYSSHIDNANVASPTAPLSLAATRQLFVDIAGGGNGYMMVYKSSSANTDRVVAMPVDANGTPLLSAPVELASGSVGAPSVAWNGSLYMVAWGDDAGVMVQRLQQDGTKIDPAPILAMPSAFGSTDIAAIGDTFLVTGRQFGSSTQFVFPVVTRVRGSDGAVLDSTPIAVGNSFASFVHVDVLGNRWLVIWRQNVTHDDPRATTNGAFVDTDGSHDPQFEIHGFYSTNGGNGAFSIGLASAGNVALVAQSQELTSGVETDLLMHLVHADGTVEPAVNLTPWIGNQYRPEVAWDGTNFVIVYQDQKNRFAPLNLDQLDARSDLFGIRVSPAGDVIDPQGFLFSASPSSEGYPNIGSLNGVSLIAGSILRTEAPYANYRIGYDLFGVGGNQWPVALVETSTTGGDAPLTVSFSSAGSTDPDGSIAAYEWDFSDGTTSNEANPIHTYVTSGEYVATLTITDNQGAKTTQTVAITVSGTGQPPAPTPTNTPAPPTPTNTPAPPTPTPTDTPAPPTPIPTNTPAPPTPIPTNTPVPPTPTPTNTPAPGGHTVYVSSSSGGTMNGISFADEDILAYDMDSDIWSMYFDGSDVGLSGSSARDVDAFHFMPDGSILLSFVGATNIPNVGSVDDSDIVRFVPTRLGTTTAGAFELYFDGSDVGLTRNGEDIDGIYVLPDGRILITTVGSVRVNGLRARDEDLLLFTPTQLGSNTSGTWQLYFDGSDIGLTQNAEDVSGVWQDANDDLYLTVRGEFRIPGVSGDGSDIFVCSPASLGSNTQCDSSMFWDGSAYGFGGENVDGIHVNLTGTTTSLVVPDAGGLHTGAAADNGPNAKTGNGN